MTVPLADPVINPAPAVLGMVIVLADVSKRIVLPVDSVRKVAALAGKVLSVNVAVSPTLNLPVIDARLPLSVKLPLPLSLKVELLDPTSAPAYVAV